jgi:hypothetical protein
MYTLEGDKPFDNVFEVAGEIEALDIINSLGGPCKSIELGYTTRSQYRTMVSNLEKRKKELKKEVKKLQKKLIKWSVEEKKRFGKRVNLMEDQYRNTIKKQNRKIKEYEVQISNDPKLQVNIVEYNRLKGKEEFFKEAVAKIERTLSASKKKASKYRSEREKYKKKYKKADKELMTLRATRQGKPGPTEIDKSKMPLYLGIGGAAVLGLILLNKKGK